MIMETGNKNNIKLGGFVVAGIILLMGALYFIGRNENTWASGLAVRVRFSDLDGLTEGNNVFYAGMPAGSVDKISIINDTTIEVKLLINKKTSAYIQRNAVASIGANGLIGDKVVNIRPETGVAPAIYDGYLLKGQEGVKVEKMLPKLVRIGDNVEVISDVLKKMVMGLDSSQLLSLLKDKQISEQLRRTLANLDRTTDNTLLVSSDILQLTNGIRKGKGTVGMLLQDTMIAHNLISLSGNMKVVTDTINQLGLRLGYKLEHGKGPLNMLLTDTTAANNLRTALINVRAGSDNFDQITEALKHNFLIRGYFNRKEKVQKALLKANYK